MYWELLVLIERQIVVWTLARIALLVVVGQKFRFSSNSHHRHPYSFTDKDRLGNNFLGKSTILENRATERRILAERLGRIEFLR